LDQVNLEMPHPGKLELGLGGAPGQLHGEFTLPASHDLTGLFDLQRIQTLLSALTHTGRCGLHLGTTDFRFI
jgi:hypothetical protein